MDTLYRVIFTVIIQVVIWFLWPRHREKLYMPSFVEVLVFSLLLLIGGILLILDLPYALDVMYVAAIVALAGVIFRLIKRKSKVPFNTFVKELFSHDATHDYGFKGFGYLMMTGFALFPITVFAYELTKIQFFVYLFGIPGIAAVVIGCCGMIYGIIRFYTPIILNLFKNEKK